jgi:hypothetical protein
VDDLAPEERTQNAIDRLSKFSTKAPDEKVKALAELLRATVDESNGVCIRSAFWEHIPLIFLSGTIHQCCKEH